MLIGYIFQSTSDPAASTAVVEAEVHSYDDVPDNGYEAAAIVATPDEGDGVVVEVKSETQPPPVPTESPKFDQDDDTKSPDESLYGSQVPIQKMS